jgi:hypothetical protein
VSSAPINSLEPHRPRFSHLTPTPSPSCARHRRLDHVDSRAPPAAVETAVRSFSAVSNPQPSFGVRRRSRECRPFSFLHPLSLTRCHRDLQGLAVRLSDLSSSPSCLRPRSSPM